MSANLWRLYLENDLAGFQQFLANATAVGGTQRTTGSAAAGHVSFKTSSPNTLATSPNVHAKGHKILGGVPSRPKSQEGKQSYGHTGGLTRADVNARDNFGRTILHLAASSTNFNAIHYVASLLKFPYVDLYMQDIESGWTALHRALYFGNIAIAQALMLRDIQDATDYSTNALHSQAGGLIKIKDREGNSPFEVFGLTIASRALHPDHLTISGNQDDEDDGNSFGIEDNDVYDASQKRSLKPRVNLLGDEVFAFGSNKNLSLGVGDENDRQYPERLTFRRPEHLLHRFQQEHTAARLKALASQNLSLSQFSYLETLTLTPLIEYCPLHIQDVIMSKLHTAVITTDPESNLFVCGFGPGGRLGTGDETTRFTYVCINSGGLASRHVLTVALGQDHSIAVASTGEVFTWGSNQYGQLGYALPQTSAANDVPIQLLPRQLYGPMKKEAIVGAAASSIHSAIFTPTALYTFGKNEGQLGLMDADARSLEIQASPRRVGVSVLQSDIQMVSAIDRATSILLESHDVVVLTHYGWTKVAFHLESFTNYFLQGSFTSRYEPPGNFICKLTSGGNTICAMSSFGEVFTVDMVKKPEPASAKASTTNPTKARNAMPKPTRVWSIRKSHMAAKDVAVGQNGSIILSTESGSVWRKEKRAKIKDVDTKEMGPSHSKDYKFVRVPNVTRAVGVRSNAYGAFVAIHRDCDVTREQVVVDAPAIWEHISGLLSFRNYGEVDNDSEAEEPEPRFWKPASRDNSPALIRRAIILSNDAEADFIQLMAEFEPLADSEYDMWITSNITEVRIPIHSFLVSGRSRIARHALAEFRQTYYSAVGDVLSIEYGQDGQIQMMFHGADFLTIVNLVFYLYTDNVVDVWHHTQRRFHLAPRFRQVRTELMKIASKLDLNGLERAVRIMTAPAKCLRFDLESAFIDQGYFSDATVTIELADGATLPAHGALLCCRCPFFDALFHGRAGGRWLISRRDAAQDVAGPVKVDLKHIDMNVFKIVLRHIYADSGEELFDDVITEDLDEFIDVVIEVMSVANELMLDRLAQVCQRILGKFVTTKNICSLLNAVAPCSVKEFMHAGLEYICLNLESMLEQRLLEELDEDILAELDEAVKQNQLAFLPFARSGRADSDLLEKHPQLRDQLEKARQQRIDAMKLQSRLHEDETRDVTLSKFRVGSYGHDSASSPGQRSIKVFSRPAQSPVRSPPMPAKEPFNDLVFEMDDDRISTATNIPVRASMSVSPRLEGKDDDPVLSVDVAQPPPEAWVDVKGKGTAFNIGKGGSCPEDSRVRTWESPTSNTPTILQITAHATGFTLPNVPWASTSPTVVKTDLKDIMAQAKRSQISNLSSALSDRNAESSRPNYKVSQRNRRKMQQLNPTLERPLSSPVPKLAGLPDPPTPKSPWQTIPTPQKKQPDLESASDAVRSLENKTSVRQQARTPLTMRQTIAGTSTSNDRPTNETRANSKPNIASGSKPQPKQIQSIRHIPLPTTISPSMNDAHSSMANILLQQETEKLAIKEAVAKRSLQEIQQEQEFQEWFDSESKRVQEETLASAVAYADSPRGGRAVKVGRGRGGRRKGSERGRSAISAGSHSQSASGKDGREGSASEPVSGLAEHATQHGRGASKQRGRARGK